MREKKSMCDTCIHWVVWRFYLTERHIPTFECPYYVKGEVKMTK